MTPAQIVTTSASRDGASFKFLWRAEADVTFESGFYHYPAYDSVCVSSQAGCNVGCVFCVTGKSASKRNLNAAEIVGQVRAVSEFRRPGFPLKVSFQGMGEPLHNYGAVVTAVDLLRSSSAAAMIGISTVGFPKLIDRLQEDAPGLKLQISVHAPGDELRHRLIPQSRGTALTGILDSASRYASATQGDLVFNYVLLAGINDSGAHAAELASVVRPFVPPGRVKVSRYNTDPELPYAASDSDVMSDFVATLRAMDVPTYEFRSKGIDIASGCGQLRRRDEKHASR